MFNSLPDFAREKSVSELFKMETFSKCWPVWKAQINDILGKNITSGKILDLGDHLSDIFSQTGGKGRGQSELSGGGAAWEALICWYLNLCTVGSQTVAFKKMSSVPSPIQKSITVNYGNSQCNTESDITVVVFPKEDNYLKIKDSILIRDDEGEYLNCNKKRGYNYKEIIDALCQNDFGKFEVGIVQCKTNWNDNAQIPMLWDMIYSVKDFKNKNISVGVGGFHINDLKKFTYSFITVPSNIKNKYKTDSVAVKRVINLSGGNYWGRPSQDSASSVKEIFNRNFQSGFKKNLRNDIELAIPSFDKELSYFNII